MAEDKFCCRFVQVMKKPSNLPDEAIDDIRTEEELKEINDSIQQGNLPMKLLKMPKDLVEAGTM